MKRNGLFKYALGFILISMISGFLCLDLSASAGPSYIKTAVTSRVDLRKYFEEAMSLFESGKYKEAIIIFEKLIEVEKSAGEAYFTPFAEIYIDKAKARMAEMMVVEDRKWERVRKSVISEAEDIAKKEKDRIALEEEKRLRAQEEARKKELCEKEESVRSTYERALEYYKAKDYPSSIVEFKKVKELAPGSQMASQADVYIKDMRREIKEKEEKVLLVKMEEARRAKIEMEKDKERRRKAHEKKEREKEALKRIFEQRLRAREAREKVLKIASLTDIIIKDIRDKKFEEAEVVLDRAIQEFPENKNFKEMVHYLDMQKIKFEEDALKKARELTEEKMLLDIAKKHILPEEKTGKIIEDEKKIMPIVKIPEIRKRMKIPISVDFKDVELDYVLGFLSDATGVNIVPSTGIDMAEKRVTIKIKDMPLEDALRYILKSQGLVYRIEEDAVWVATKEELDNEKIETRVYFLNQGIGRFAEFTSQGSVSTSGESESGSSPAALPSEVKTVKNILENTVEWPKDSKLTLDDRTGALIVSNTPSNLETIENLLYNLDITPLQVLIEARFLEVKVTDLDDLGVEWKLNSFADSKISNSGQGVHGFAKNSGVDFSNFSRADEGFNLTYQGILSHPQFQAVIHALQEKQDVKTLSAPRITTLNNQTATIEVVDEYIYPTRYEVSLVQYDINGDGDFDDAGETEWANIPQDFVTRNVGILLHVKPTVGVDKKNITLAMTPEVSEDAGTFAYSGSVNIPKFTTRNLSTSVMVQNGETVVLGGLIKESNTNVKTKVPLLGDLPIVGGLFRKSTDSKERRNLLIFVTASILDKQDNRVASAAEDTYGVARESVR